MGIASIVAGVIGYITAINHIFFLTKRLAIDIDPARHHLFLTAGWAHSAAYIVGLLGGIVLCIKIVLKRRQLNH